MKTHLPVNCSSGHRKQGESELISVWPRPLAFHEGQRETRSRFSQGHRVQLDKSFTHFVGGVRRDLRKPGEYIYKSLLLNLSSPILSTAAYVSIIFSFLMKPGNQIQNQGSDLLMSEVCFSVLRDKVPNHQWKDDCLHFLHSSTSGDAAALSSSSVCSGKSMNNNID